MTEVKLIKRNNESIRNGGHNDVDHCDLGHFVELDNS